MSSFLSPRRGPISPAGKPGDSPKWHIDNNGKVGRCRAKNGSCPFAPELHSSTRDGAAKAYQAKMSSRQFSTMSRPQNYTPNLPFSDIPEPLEFQEYLQSKLSSCSLQEALDLRFFHDNCPYQDSRKALITEFFDNGSHPFYANFPNNGMSSQDIVSYANQTLDGKNLYPLEQKLSSDEKISLNRKFQKLFLAQSQDQDYLRKILFRMNDWQKDEEMAYCRNMNVPEDARPIFIKQLRHESTALNIYYNWDSEIRSRFRIYSFSGRDTMIDYQSPSSFEIEEEDKQILKERFPVIRRLENLKNLRDSGQLNSLLNPKEVRNYSDNLIKAGYNPDIANDFSGTMDGYFDIYDTQEVARLGLDRFDMKLLADFFRPYPKIGKKWSNSKYDPKTGIAGNPLAGEIHNWITSH